MDLTTLAITGQEILKDTEATPTRLLIVAVVSLAGVIGFIYRQLLSERKAQRDERMQLYKQLEQSVKRHEEHLHKEVENREKISSHYAQLYAEIKHILKQLIDKNDLK